MSSKYVGLWLLCCGLVLAGTLPPRKTEREYSVVNEPRQENLDSTEPTSPASLLRTQFIRPAEVLAVLLIIGGDIVQKACAQLVSGSRIPFGKEDTDEEDQSYFSFTPVAFSFGWVAYAFSALMSAFGDGSLMPAPDVSCLVATVGGQCKLNESWVIGRLVRDLELCHKRPPGGMEVHFYKTLPNSGKPSRDRVWWSFVFFFTCQFGLSLVPLFIHGSGDRNWTIIMITAAGTALALVTSSMPQWGQEKYSGRKNGKGTFVLTRGNGHSHVFVIRVDPNHNFKNLDDLATVRLIDSPLTRVATVVLAVFWIFLLITVGGLEEDTWFLLGVGLIGMAHNVFVAGWRREPDAHGLPIVVDKSVNVILSWRVMAALEEAEGSIKGVGLAMVGIFFPAGLTPEQEKGWKDREKAYQEVKRASKQAAQGDAHHADVDRERSLHRKEGEDQGPREPEQHAEQPHNILADVRTAKHSPEMER